MKLESKMGVVSMRRDLNSNLAAGNRDANTHTPLGTRYVAAPLHRPLLWDPPINSLARDYYSEQPLQHAPSGRTVPPMASGCDDLLPATVLSVAVAGLHQVQ